MFSTALKGIWGYTLFKNAYISIGQPSNRIMGDRLFCPAGVKLTVGRQREFFDAVQCDRLNISLCYLNDKMKPEAPGWYAKCLLTF